MSVRTVFLRQARPSTSANYPLFGRLASLLLDPGYKHDYSYIRYREADAHNRRGRRTLRGLDRRSEELQTPAEYVMGSAHSGTESWEQSFLEVGPSSIAVLALKRAEQQDAVIVRLQERAGAAAEAALKSSLWRLDHRVRFSPWEIKTLHLKTAKGKRAEVQEVSLLED